MVPQGKRKQTGKKQRHQKCLTHKLPPTEAKVGIRARSECDAQPFVYEHHSRYL
jgi:hypothetical protein